MATKKVISLRAGTYLTYNIRRGFNKISRSLQLQDIEYIKPNDKDDVFIAISLKTGVTALGETPEKSYSSLIFKLYNYLRDAMSAPKAEIGEEVSEDLKKESLYALKMPKERQLRALKKGIRDFIEFHEGSALIISKIEFDPTPIITTDNLEDTLIPIDVVVSDTHEVVSK